MGFRRAIRLSCLVLTIGLLLPLAAGCGPGSGDDRPETVTWKPATMAAPTEQPTATHAPPAATPTLVPPGVGLSPDELRDYQPNELGSIPVLEYHVITTDEAKEADPFVRTAEHLREDLQWLYDHDFHVITTREFIENWISAPAGKRPVILSFDDSHASQFRWIDQGDNVRLIDPDTAMGVLEAFFRKHPDFGRGGQFAVLSFNCFADDTPLNTIEDCPDKLRWMAANGYEIVNHTAGHQDLLDVTDEEFIFQVGEPIVWLDEIVQGDGNLMDVIVMPYGNYPSRDLHPGQREMMRNGFTYEGREIQLRGAFMVGANPTESPSSTEYDPLFIARIQAYAASLDQWFGMIDDGDILIYVSDGNPETITIPEPVPPSLAHQLDADTVTAGGRELVRYDPASGELVSQDMAVTRTGRRQPEVRFAASNRPTRR